MTPEKRKKIKALMDSPVSTMNEKQICKRLLATNPELVTDPPVNPYFGRPPDLEADAQAHARQKAANQRQTAWDREFIGQPYNSADFKKAQAAIDTRLKQMNDEITKRLEDLIADKLKGRR